MQLLTTRNSNTQNPLQDLRYTYDPVGNIVEIYDASMETSYYNNSGIEPRHQFTYDALCRLLSGTGRELMGLAQTSSGGYAANSAGAADAKALHSYTQNFAYDELGNIKSIQHQTNTSTLNWTRNYVYDEATNRLLKHDEYQTLPDYTYDEHGNITKMPNLQSMHYDHKDQLDSVVLDASNNMAYYIYDANGQRVRKVVVKGNVREERIYVGGYERYIKTENGSQTIERISVSIAEVAEEPREEEENSRAVYHIDLNKRIALIEYIEGQSPTIRYQLGNHLGSASLELDATGQIISYEEFHPFGTTSYRSGTNETEVSLKRYKYIGKERDEETGLYYYGARYYAAWIGRFVSVDPMQHEYPHYTPFQYAGNTPISAIDLDGLEPLFVITGITTHKSDETNAGHKRGSYYFYKVEVYENMTIGEYRELYDKGFLQRPDAVGFIARDAWNKSKRGENRYSTNNELPPGEGYLNYWPKNSPGRFRLYFGAEKKGSKNRTIINGVSIANDRVVFGPDGPRGGIAVHQWSPNDAEGCLTTGYGNQDSEDNFFNLSKSLKEFEFGFYIVEERKVFFHNATKSWRGVENTTRPLPQWIIDIYNDEDLILKPDNTATQTPFVYE